MQYHCFQITLRDFQGWQVRLSKKSKTSVERIMASPKWNENVTETLIVETNHSFYSATKRNAPLELVDIVKSGFVKEFQSNMVQTWLTNFVCFERHLNTCGLSLGHSLSHSNRESHSQFCQSSPWSRTCKFKSGTSRTHRCINLAW